MMIWWAVFVLELSSILTFWQILCHQLEMTLWRWFTQKMRVTAAWWCDTDSDPPAEPVLPHLEIVDRHCCHCANVISSTAASSWFYSPQQRDRFVRCHVSVQRSPSSKLWQDSNKLTDSQGRLLGVDDAVSSKKELLGEATCRDPEMNARQPSPSARYRCRPTLAVDQITDQ